MEYQSEGFLEKNRDTVYEEQINILKASKVKAASGEMIGAAAFQSVSFMLAFLCCAAAGCACKSSRRQEREVGWGVEEGIREERRDEAAGGYGCTQVLDAHCPLLSSTLVSVSC